MPWLLLQSSLCLQDSPGYMTRSACQPTTMTAMKASEIMMLNALSHYSTYPFSLFAA